MSFVFSLRPTLKAALIACSLTTLGVSAIAASPAWKPDTFYRAGDLVTYGGKTYRAILNQVDYTATGWNPTTTSLWTPVGDAATAATAATATASVTPTQPASTSTSTSTSTPAASTASGSSSATCKPWQSGTTYLGGDFASLNGRNYRANWWTQDNPAQYNGPAGSGQPWTAASADVCKSTGTSAPAAVPAPVAVTTPVVTTPVVTTPAATPSPTPSTSTSTPSTTTPTKADTSSTASTTTTASTSLIKARQADQSKRVMVGYYPSWSSPWFDASGKTDEQIFKTSELASVSSTYTHVVVSFASPEFRWNGLSSGWDGTGLSFSMSPADVKAAIDVLHRRNIKVLLAVGGATYNEWTSLANEGRQGDGPITQSLTRVMQDLGFDGLDVDYETDADIARYAYATKAMRQAVDKAGNGRVLSAAGWSTGADCTADTSSDAACSGKVSYWGGNAGRERQLMQQYPAIAAKLDMVHVMSYDAGALHFDPLQAYAQYRQLFPASTIVSIGMEPAQEAWGGAQLVINNVDAQCNGSTVVQDQYGSNLNQPYSVERALNGVIAHHGANQNPRDGAMLWSIQKNATGLCGAAPLATPTTLVKKVAETFGLPKDATAQP